MMVERAIVPMWQLERRIPTAGRIRLGEKGKNGAPKKLSRFRFTSADKEAICEIAALYGGTVKPWEGAPTPNQWQVTIESERVRVTLPPDPLGDGPVYELFSAGGCQRRCDGVEVVTPASPETEPCICDKQGRLDCKVTTRLNVILREIPFRGVWRLESHGWSAAHELPGVVDLVLAVQSAGLPVAELGVEERRQVTNGQTRRFNVPVLSAPITIDELASGLGTVHALGSVPAPRELGAGDAGVDVGAGAGAGTDDGDVGAEASGLPDALAGVDGADADVRDPAGDWEIEDAVIVEEGPGTDDDPSALGTQAPAPVPGPSSTTIPPWQKALHATIAALDLGDLTVDEFRHGLVRLVTNGCTQSSSALDRIERAKAFDLLAELKLGDRRIVGLRDDGTLRVSQRKDS